MMAGSSLLLPPNLSAEHWRFLLQQTVSFAAYQLARLRWRGHFGGVLPAGFDATSIASQAILEFLQEWPEPSDTLSTINSQPSASSGLDATLWQIRRLVLRHVTRLHHLKENYLLASEADLAPVPDLDGDPVSPLEFIPSPDIQPDQALIRKELFLEYYDLQFRFRIFLSKERRLIRLFDLNCSGISKPQILAARLKLGVRTIESLQKRLRRKWLSFSRLRRPQIMLIHRIILPSYLAGNQ